MTEEQRYKIHEKPPFNNASLVVAWSEDAGQLGYKVADYVNNKLEGSFFCEIEPEGFFPLDGVTVKNDVAQFPESKFYYYRDKNLVILKSNAPRQEWYKFLNLILDISDHYCHIRELYTIGGIFSSSAHTTPRSLVSITNSSQMKTDLKPYDLNESENYETPSNQNPTLSSYLLWLAKHREIKGASLWVQIPFYLASISDPRACIITMNFLNRRFDLGIDMTSFDEEMTKQDEKIKQLISRFPEINDYIHKLESNLTLPTQESNKLAEIMADYLDEKIELQ